jgi:hypothetical protein
VSISNYPNGFSNGITIRGVPLHVSHPGQIFFVNNSSVIAPGGIGGSDGNPGSYQKPFSTLDYAIGRCTANRGDIIFVMPGHVETLATAAAIALDVAGVAVIGLGVGSLRPKLNFTATAATMTMSAANCSIKNILFTGGIDAVVSPLVISAADCTVEQCELRDVTGQMTNGILTTAAADRLKILDHVHRGDTAAGTGAAIAIVGGDSIEITAKVIDGNFSVGAIDVRTTATTNLWVHDIGRMYTRNAADILIVDTITASTGQIGPNINGRLTDNAANITEAFTGATFVYMQPLNLVNLAGESSMQSNITASTDA